MNQAGIVVRRGDVFHQHLPFGRFLTQSIFQAVFLEALDRRDDHVDIQRVFVDCLPLAQPGKQDGRALIRSGAFALRHE